MPPSLSSTFCPSLGEIGDAGIVEPREIGLLRGPGRQRHRRLGPVVRAQEHPAVAGDVLDEQQQGRARDDAVASRERDRVQIDDAEARELARRKPDLSGLRVPGEGHGGLPAVGERSFLSGEIHDRDRRRARPLFSMKAIHRPSGEKRGEIRSVVRPRIVEHLARRETRACRRGRRPSRSPEGE